MSESFNQPRSNNNNNFEGSSKSHSKSHSKHNHHKHSMCSSELESRVEAMRIQLEEERKRRLNVEQQIQDLVYTRGGPQAAAVAKILKESDLQSLSSQQQMKKGSGSLRSGASVRSMSSSQRSNAGIPASASYGRQQLPPIDQQQTQTQTNSSIPQPPARRDSQLGTAGTNEDIVTKCEREATECDKLIRQLNHDHAAVLSRKPPLPQAARGIASRKTGGGAFGCDYVMARRSKATPAQLYMMNQWHQERMDKINAFTFGIAGGNGSY